MTSGPQSQDLRFVGRARIRRTLDKYGAVVLQLRTEWRGRVLPHIAPPRRTKPCTQHSQSTYNLLAIPMDVANTVTDTSDDVASTSHHGKPP